MDAFVNLIRLCIERYYIVVLIIIFLSLYYVFLLFFHLMAFPRQKKTPIKHRKHLRFMDVLV